MVRQCLLLSSSSPALADIHQSLAAPTSPLQDDDATKTAHPLLKYTPGPLPFLLRTILKDPHGMLRIGRDGVLRSYAADASVLDYRHLSSDQTHGLAPDGRGVLSEAAIFRSLPPLLATPTTTPRDRGRDYSAAAGAGLGAVGVGVFAAAAARSTDPAAVAVDPEILGECAPPVACWNSTTCGGGCGACTYFGFFPYGLCLSS
ncbi:hypothetical protein ACJ41O_000533 [Fusarium nematophilum]